MSSKRRNLSALVFLINSTTKGNLKWLNVNDNDDDEPIFFFQHLTISILLHAMTSLGSTGSTFIRWCPRVFTFQHFLVCSMLITYLLNYSKVCSRHKMKKVSGYLREKREKWTVKPVPFELLSGHTKYTVCL